MDSNSLSPTVASATLASAHVGNRNLSTAPKRMAIIKVRGAMLRGARKCGESKHFLAIYNRPRLVGVTPS